MSVFEPTGSLGTMPERDEEFSWTAPDDETIPIERDAPLPLARLFAVVGLVSLLLVGRLAFLQVAEGKDHQLLAQGNRIRVNEILPSRGLITDRFGTVLATNVASFALTLVPADLSTDRAQRDTVYELAARLADADPAALKERSEAGGVRSLQPIILKDHLAQPDAIADKVAVGDTPGLSVVEQPQRSYERLPGLAHILGYTGKVNEEQLAATPYYSYRSVVGKTGIEQTYDSRLYGRPGIEQVEVNSKGYFQRVVGEQPPVPGETVALTLDAGLQRVLGETLAAKAAEVQAAAASAVALDPRDGSVLAMVSLPDYDGNLFAGGISADDLAALTTDPNHPLNNRAIAGLYPSGSVVKPVVAAAGLAEGVITEQTTLDVPGEIRIGDFVFPDWKVHGLTDVRKALSVSSDIFFYAVGGGWDKVSGLGISRLDRYLMLFGFGERTGIDLPGEAAGLVPTPEWKQRVKHEGWFTGDTYHLAIGQGDFLSTPLQVVHSIAIVANRGVPAAPHLVASDPVSAAAPVVDDRWLEIVRQGMKQSVESGSSRQLQALPVTSGGKTGTAQFGTEDKTHAWFTAFAPYDNPEIAIVVLVEGGGEGNEIAEPVAVAALQWFFGEAHARYDAPR